MAARMWELEQRIYSPAERQTLVPDEFNPVMRFRRLVQRAVEQSGSVRALAEMVDVSVPTVERWLSGKNSPAPLARERFAAWLERYLSQPRPVDDAAG